MKQDRVLTQILLCCQIRCVEDRGSVRCAIRKYESGNSPLRRARGRSYEMQNRPAVVTLSIAAALISSVALLGQNNSQAPAQPAAAKTESPAASHNISGVWDAMRNNYDFASFSKGDPLMTPWGKQQFDAAKPSQGPHGVKLSETTDKVYKCFPAGHAVHLPANFPHANRGDAQGSDRAVRV